jgi:SAM-dependent methyltransferase
MENYDASTYGERIAEVYDRFFGGLFDDRATVDFLADQAGGGPVLELGIGTGRIALPLAAHGLEVHGVDASQAMIGKLRAKPGGEDLPVVFADFADFRAPASYGLVFVVFNTIFGLASQDDQVRCFECVARHLRPEGCFVVEAFVPDSTRFDRHQRVQVNSVEVDEIMLTADLHDPVAQRVHSQHVTVSEAGIKLYPVSIRYAWPSELDLMARLAGLELKQRFADWHRGPFTSSSPGHVSVYGF